MKRMAKQCLIGLWVGALLAGAVPAQEESGGTARVSDAPGPLPSVADQVYPGTPGPGSGYFAVNPVENTRRISAFLGTDAVGAGRFATFPVAASRQPVSGIRRRTARRIRE